MALGAPSKAAAKDATLTPERIIALRRENKAIALREPRPGRAPAAPSFRFSPSELPVAAPAVQPALATEAAAESAVTRMQRELGVAMAKPMSQRKWGMVIDLNKCIGCSACTIACIAENHLPPGIAYRPVIEEEIGEFPNVTRRFTPRPCMQCDEPPCVPVCPVSATYKRPDGIVEVNYDKCIGCRYCMVACPYAARYFDFGERYSDDTPAVQPYEEAHSPEYGQDWSHQDVEGVVRKCQFCLHRLEAGMLPACVTTCIGGATYFGDLNDAESLVSEIQASGRVVRLKEELGTKPKVSYLL